MRHTRREIEIEIERSVRAFQSQKLTKSKWSFRNLEWIFIEKFIWVLVNQSCNYPHIFNFTWKQLGDCQLATANNAYLKIKPFMFFIKNMFFAFLLFSIFKTKEIILFPKTKEEEKIQNLILFQKETHYLRRTMRNGISHRAIANVVVFFRFQSI